MRNDIVAQVNNRNWQYASQEVTRLRVMLARTLTVALAIAACGASTPLESCLHPGEERLGAFIAFAVPVSFCFRELAPSSTYELRLSYPGTQPTRFTFALSESEPLAGHLPGRVLEGDGVRLSGRRLADTDKLVFVTDKEGSIVHRDLPGATPQSRVACLVSAEEVSLTPAVGPQRVGTRVNIKLDPVYGGVLPATALHLLVPLAGCVIAALLVGTWLLRSPRSPLFFNYRRGGGGPLAVPLVAEEHPSGKGRR